MTRLLLCLPFIALALGCDSRCDDLRAREIDGRYTWQPESDENVPGPSGGKVISAEVDASDERVVFTYELTDGSRYRATYRVKSERKER